MGRVLAAKRLNKRKKALTAVLICDISDIGNSLGKAFMK
jgi:hypothetical protein